MSGRFDLFARLDVMEDNFDAEFAFDYEPRYNIAPEGPGVAAVRYEASERIDQLHWGLLHHWVDELDEFSKPIVPRSETAAEKPAFSEAFRKCTGLVPASIFYEWTVRKGRRLLHHIGVADQEVFTMAGLRESWSSNADELRSVTINSTDGKTSSASSATACRSSLRMIHQKFNCGGCGPICFE